MEQSCPTCGYQNPGDSNFCMYCGNKLEIIAVSTKVSQFRFPSVRSFAAGSTGSTGYNLPVDPGNTDSTEYNLPLDSGVTEPGNIEYNSLVNEGTDNIGDNAPASSGGAGNVAYDLPTGWITSNAEYSSPVGGAVGNIGYDAPISSEEAGNIGLQLPFSSDEAGNIGFQLPFSSSGAGNIGNNLPASSSDAGNVGFELLFNPEGISNSTYKPLVGSRYSAENKPQQQVQQMWNVGALTSRLEQLGSVLRSISGRLPRHAFAGRGSRMVHHSWLLDGEYLNAAKLHTAVANLLSQRSSQTLKLNIEKLQEQGHWTEEREYIVMQQGITTVFLYVAPAGQDLYISRTTTVRAPFNPFRIFLLIFALGELLFGPSVLSKLLSSLTIHRSVGAGIALIVPITIAILLIPSVLFLVTFLFASFRHWLTEKDFWVYLRRNTLNDFEVDDVMLLEHATDDAVRAAVDQLKLDATRIIPPVTGYQPRRRIRII